MGSALRQSVRDKFLNYTAPLEGDAVPHMYADVIGLITVAYGNLIDSSQNTADPAPWTPALALPWRNRDGSLAPPAQVKAEWLHLKACAHDLERRSLGVQAGFTTVRLDRDACADLVFQRLEENAAFITSKHFSEFASFPADAQLAIMSLAWAAGSDWPRKLPHCKAAVLARDWHIAAAEGKLSMIAADGHTPNPGVRPRNDAQIICFANAAAVQEKGLDPTVCYWPAFPHPLAQEIARAAGGVA